MHKMLSVLAISAMLLPAAARAEEPVPLNRDEHINASLVSAAIAEGIRQNCSSISARMLRALRKADELEQYALDRGFSENEIKTFINDKVEKKRIVEQARAYMTARGVVEGQNETFCVLGRAEIKRGSLIGYLLFSWR